MKGKLKNILKKAFTFGLAALTVVGTAGSAVSPVKRTTVNADNTYTCTNSPLNLGGYGVTPKGKNHEWYADMSHMYLDGSAFCIEPENMTNGAVNNTYVEQTSGLPNITDAMAGYAYVSSIDTYNTPRYYRAAQFLIWQELGATVGQTEQNGTDVTAEMKAIQAKYSEMKGQGYTFTAKAYGQASNPTGGSHSQWLMSSAAAVMPFVDVNVTANIHKTSANTSITDNNPNYSLAGAVFEVEVTGPADGKGQLTSHSETVTTDANGDASFSHTFAQMPEGTKAADFDIKVTEITASQGYLKNTDIFTLKSGGTANVPEKPINDPTGVNIEKVSDDGNSNPKSLAGAEFTLKYYAVDPNTINSVADLNGISYETWTGNTTKTTSGKYRMDFTNVQGDTHKDEKGSNTIPVGVVTIEETKAPAGYTLENKVVTVSGNEVTADSNGVVMLKVVPDPNANTGARINFGNEYTVSEHPVRGGFRIAKFDKELNKADEQGDATSLSAKFQVINNNNYNVVSIDKDGTKIEAAPGQVAYTFTTSDDGKFESSNSLLPSGNYTIQEVEAPTDYTLNGTTSASLTISDTVAGEIHDFNGTIQDTPVRGSFAFQKIDAETGLPTPEGNAKIGPADYEVITQSVNPVLVDKNQDGTLDRNNELFSKGDVVFTFTTDENGHYVSPEKLLPYGTYTIIETKNPEGYNLDGTAAEGVTIEIRNNGVPVPVEATNTVQRGSFTMTKRDFTDKTVTPEGDASLLGGTYNVINKSTNAVLVDKNQDGTLDKNTEMFAPGEVVFTFTTDENNTKNGIYTAPSKLLPYGNYALEEANAPEGYQTTTDNGATTSVDFTIDSEGLVVELTRNSDISNTPMRGTFSVKKNDLYLGTNIPEGDNDLSGKYALVNKSAHAVYVDTNGNGHIDLNTERFESNEVIRDRSNDSASKKMQYSLKTAKDGTFSWTNPVNGEDSYWAGLP